jgi:transcriptional regulator, araC family
LYGSYEAQRWGNKYIYYCPKEYIFIANPVYDDDGRSDKEMEFSVVSGPIAMGEPEDFTDETAPILSTSQVNALAEILWGLLCRKTEPETEPTEFLKDIYNVMEEIQVTSKGYPIELEKQLQLAIVGGDNETAKEMLNRILGHIYFSSNNDLETIKSRALELIVLLSRSAIEGGADAEQIFSLNGNYVKQVEKFDNIVDLSVWLTDVINRFISYVFEFGEVKHTDTILKAIRYIKDNYSKKITLEDVANHVYLSKSYLSKIFKEETGVNLVSFLNKVRIDKSKLLLANSKLSLIDIANLIGFDDQSYFTKVFKSIVGVSPGKYREKYI